MIRINLLPVKELMVAEQKRRELTIGGVVLAVAGVALVALFFYQSYTLSALNKEHESLRSEIQALNVKVKQLAVLQVRIKEVQAKQKVIGDLNTRRAGPVGVMESLAAATPTRLWLTEFRETGGWATLTGFAADNQTVAEFLTALAKSEYFRDVELIETTQGAKEFGSYRRFAIRAAVLYLPPARDKKEEKKS